MEQTISDLTDKECNWLQLQRDAARQFGAWFLPTADGTPMSLASSQLSFKEWMVGDPNEVDEVKRVINGVGIAFGQSVVDGVELR